MAEQAQMAGMVADESDVAYEQAPSMPRYPTLIRGQLPRAGTTDFEEDPTLHNPLPDTLQPPPRFPSMPDVALNKAKAAAAAKIAADGQPASDQFVGRLLEQEIAATIERDAVEPGAARARASAAASKQWSSMDQRRLNSLLESAQSMNAHKGGGGDGSGDTGATTSETKAAPVGVARSMPSVGAGGFPSALATVPMKQFSAPGADSEEQFEQFVAEDDINEKHGAMVTSSSQTAKVAITGDFGLKGGHTGVVHDTVFFDSTTLVTGGADGKVCIWDLQHKYVTSEFEPYNGLAVRALYGIEDTTDGPAATRSLITFSVDRLMRVWNLVDGQAVLLRSMQIPDSNRDLVMSVPVLTPQMKAHAAAAAAAAAVVPTDYTEEPPPSLDTDAFSAHPKAPAYRGGIAEAMRGKENTTAHPPVAAGATTATAPSTTLADTPKRFSFNIFGRNKSRKAVAS